MNELSKILSVAAAEVGYLEKNSNSNLDSFTANAGYNNWTKYARDLDAIGDFYNGPKNGYAWCDVFVDWCFVKSFGVERALELTCQPRRSCGAGVGYSYDYYKKKGQAYSTPQPGDQIFFKNSSGNMQHTGLVEKVDGSYVYTIEGNTSTAAGVVANGGGVARKKYSLSYSLIAGYGRPKYKIDETIIPVAKTATDAEIEQLAKDVLAGKYGNGDERKARLGDLYSAVQRKVNELVGGKASTITYTVVKGDTLSGIGKKYNVNWKDIASLNGVKGPLYIIHVGQVLTIPGGAPAKQNYSGTFPTLPSRGYFVKGDKGTQVKNLQKLLNWLTGANLVIDGDLGNNTYNAVKKFQTDNGLVVDGLFGSKSLAKAKSIQK